MKNKIHIWYDEEGDYLEINLKKCKDTYFNETRKDFSEIIDKKTENIVGYAIFNFIKGNRPIDIELSIPKGILA